MRYKRLGPSGLRVSELCLGTMTFGTAWGWGGDLDACRAMFDAFVAAFCEAVDRYPAWKSQNVFYQSGDTGVGHTLGTRAMQLHYGAACE